MNINKEILIHFRVHAVTVNIKWSIVLLKCIYMLECVTCPTKRETKDGSSRVIMSTVIDQGKSSGDVTGRHRVSLAKKEFYCGFGAAFINICITFPINKVIFRQMLDGVRAKSALQQLQNEGIHYLYMGIIPPLLQKSVSTSLMFGLYDYYTKLIKSYSPQIDSSLCCVLSSFLTGTCEASLNPFERTQTLLQDKANYDKFTNTYEAFCHVRSYGYMEFYRGFVPVVFRNGPSNVLFFGLREPIRNQFPRSNRWTDSIGDFISGAMLGAGISTIVYPMNVVKTRMQSVLGGPFRSAWRTLLLIYNERGRSVRKMFLGVHVNNTRALISWGIVNASCEALKKIFFSDDESCSIIC